MQMGLIVAEDHMILHLYVKIQRGHQEVLGILSYEPFILMQEESWEIRHR